MQVMLNKQRIIFVMLIIIDIMIAALVHVEASVPLIPPFTYLGTFLSGAISIAAFWNVFQIHRGKSSESMLLSLIFLFVGLVTLVIFLFYWVMIELYYSCMRTHICL